MKTFSLNRSLYGSAYWFLLIVGAASSLYLLTIPTSLLFFLSVVLGIESYRVLNRFILLRSPKSIAKIVTDESGQTWTIESQSKERVSGVLLHESICLRHLTILRFNVPGRKRPLPVCIFPGTLSADQFRRLRATLRWC